MSLLPSERAQFSAIIDGILLHADLQTITASSIRKQLQAKLNVDVIEKKDAVKALIMERFDHATSGVPAIAPLPAPSSPPQHSPKAHTNGVSQPHPKKIKSETKVKRETSKSDRAQHFSDDDDPSPKKRRKPNKGIKEEGDGGADADAKLAAKLQAEENSRSRATRGGGVKRKAPTKKRAPKKKSSDKVKAEDDSDIELGSDGEVKEKVKKGGFHKEYNLSAPLADVLGVVTCSRPKVVKKIWEYIKAQNLQDPTDKRQIRCDEKMQLLLKQDTVHMFTMNKLLSKHLYDIEE